MSGRRILVIWSRKLEPWSTEAVNSLVNPSGSPAKMDASEGQCACSEGLMQTPLQCGRAFKNDNYWRARLSNEVGRHEIQSLLGEEDSNRAVTQVRGMSHDIQESSDLC